MKASPVKVRVTVTNHTLGHHYSEVMDEGLANIHISALGLFKPKYCPQPAEHGLCGCHLTIKVEDAC